MTRFVRPKPKGWGEPGFRSLRPLAIIKLSSGEGVDALLAKFSAGTARVGVNAIDILGWAVSFAQMSREEMASELAKEDSLLIYEVARFVGNPALIRDKRRRSRVLHVHDQLEAMLTVYADQGRWSFKAKEVTFVLNGRGSTAGEAELFYRSEDRNTRFLLDVARLLEREGARLERCAASDCRRLFIVQKHTKKYCCTACEQRVNTKRWRELNPGKAAAIQLAYYQRKTDPRVKKAYQRKAQRAIKGKGNV